MILSRMIDLADEHDALRFLLWGGALLGGGFSNCIDAAMQLLVARALDYPFLGLTHSFAGLVAAICLTLTFWPGRGRTAPSRA